MEASSYLHRVGTKVTVKITSIASYGAFCQLDNGESGLIHISEIDGKFISSIPSYLPLGSLHEALIVEYGKKPGTYSLSIKRISKRRRQNIPQTKKPPSRKAYNKVILDSYGPESMFKALGPMVEEEYSRLMKN